jgi:predicted kinase
MGKLQLNKPILITVYGFPGSGKSYFARNLANYIQIAHLDADRLRAELFRSPKYDQQENAVIFHLMNYLADTLLAAGVSVVYDTNALRIGQRRRLRELAEKHKAEYLLVWMQIDAQSAFDRTQRRDRRTFDDKFAEPQSQETFQRIIGAMQNPQDENYLVVSGKHAFVTQKSALISRLYQLNLITSETVRTNIAKPGLINIVPNPHGNNPHAGRVDYTRRNINIS